MTPLARILVSLVLLVALATAGWILVQRIEPERFEPVSPGSERTIDGARQPPATGGGDAAADGAGTERTGIAEPTTPERTPVQLPGTTAESLDGRVVDPERRPIRGATLMLYRKASAVAMFPVLEPLDLTATTGSDGRYRIPSAPAGIELLLRARADGFVAADLGPLRLPAGVSKELEDLVLERSLTLAGQVLSDLDLKPVPDATVAITAARPTSMVALDGSEPAPVVTDADGRFEQPGLAPARYLIHISAQGFAGLTEERSFLLSRHLRVVEQSFHLAPATGSATGLVLSVEGEPVPGASVLAIAAAESTDRPLPHEVRALAGADGTFELTGLLRAPYLVTATAPGLFATEPIRVEPDARDVRLRVRAGGALHGSVVLPGGGSPERATVRVLAEHGPNRSARSVRVDPSGRFRTSDLAPGVYRLEASAAAAAPVRSEPMEIRSGESIQGIVLRLRDGGTITGTVVQDGAGGAPLPRALVALLPDRLKPFSPFAEAHLLEPLHGVGGESGSDGRFRLEHVPAGTYAIRILARNGSSATIRGASVEDGATLDLGTIGAPAAGAIDGQAFDLDGLPLPGQSVSAWCDATLVRRQVRTDPRGRFRMEALPAGVYRVRIDLPERWESFQYRSEMKADVQPGTSASVNVRIEKRS